MNSYFSKSLIVLLSALVASAPALGAKKQHTRKDRSHRCVKFVKGGACKGNGSKKRPYNSLAEAQADESWDTLVVLPSPVTLDGSIVLRPGTTLTGTCDPTCGPISPDQATITNSNADLNGGNAVVVQGDARIRKLYFKDTWASAINYDNGRNVSVEKVLITGHNQGDVQILSPVEGIFVPVSGIFGFTSLDGETHLKQVIVRDNNTGGGIIELSMNKAQRRITVEQTELAGLRSLAPSSSSLVEQSYGMNFVGFDSGTHQDVHIKKCFVHDFRPNEFPGVDAEGIELDTFSGALLTACIDECSFQNIHNNQFFTAHVLMSTRGKPEQGVNTVRVNKCRFEEPLENADQPIAGVQSQVFDSAIHLTVTDNYLANILDNVVSLPVNGTTKERLLISGNCGSGNELFFTSYNIGANAVTEGYIFNNSYIGGALIGGIGILLGHPWEKLALKVEKNRLEGQGNGLAGFFALPFGGQAIGPDALLDAGCGNLGSKGKNSIVGYNFDILNESGEPGLSIIARKNWWGPGTPCAGDNDCAPTQECKKGICVGPDNVVNDSSAIVDVSCPLSHPPTCPKDCQCVFPTSAPNSTSQKDAYSAQQHVEAFKKRVTSRLSKAK